MVSPNDDPKLTADEVVTVMEMYALTDANGTLPGFAGWVETLDWYGAAMELWQIKAGRAAKFITTNADGQQMSMSDLKKHCNEQVSRYTALRQTGTATVVT